MRTFNRFRLLRWVALPHIRTLTTRTRTCTPYLRQHGRDAIQMLGAALIAFRDGRVPPNAVSSEFILSKKGGAEGAEDTDKTEIDLGTVAPTSLTTSVVAMGITLPRCLYFFVITSVTASVVAIVITLPRYLHIFVIMSVTTLTASVMAIAITLPRCLYLFVITSVVAVSSRVEILCLCQQRTLEHARDVQHHYVVAHVPRRVDVGTPTHLLTLLLRSTL